MITGGAGDAYSDEPWVVQARHVILMSYGVAVARTLHNFLPQQFIVFDSQCDATSQLHPSYIPAFKFLLCLDNQLKISNANIKTLLCSCHHPFSLHHCSFLADADFALTFELRCLRALLAARFSLRLLLSAVFADSLSEGIVVMKPGRVRLLKLCLV